MSMRRQSPGEGRRSSLIRVFPRGQCRFHQVLDPHHIRLRVYERGAGETLACGTGARLRSGRAGIARGLLESPVRVDTRGGELSIAWGSGRPVLMTGPAVSVFDAEIELP